MPDTNGVVTILIREGTPLPANQSIESEAFLPGWRLARDLDGYGLDRKIREAGWTSFWLAGETRATVFGIDEEKMVLRAIKEILARLEAEKFNSLEITRVTSVASKRFLGVRYVTVSARSRLIQQGVGLVPAKDFALRMSAAPESLSVSAIERHDGELAIKQSMALISSS
jgi:hypothetical protein